MERRGRQPNPGQGKPRAGIEAQPGLQPAAQPGGERIHEEIRRDIVRGPQDPGVAEKPESPVKKAERKGAKKSTKIPADARKGAERRPVASTGRTSQRELDARQEALRGQEERLQKRERIADIKSELLTASAARKEALIKELRMVSPEEARSLEARLEAENMRGRKPWRGLRERVRTFGFRRPQRETIERTTDRERGSNAPVWLAGGALAAGLILAICGPQWIKNIQGVPSGKDETTPRAGLVTPTPSAAAGTPRPPERGTPAPTRTPETGFQPGTKTTGAGVAENTYTIKHPDMDGKTVDKQLPQGFTPDARLVTAPDLSPRPINPNLSAYKDWETVLNTGRAVGDRLAGYNYDYNDFCDNVDFRCNVQGDMFAWRVFQGQTVEVPGVGRLEGGPRRSVMVLFINMEPDVVAWDKDELGQVMVKRGFTATGRMFDGNKMPVMEENLVGHWSFRQGSGTPEKSYVGITDHPENANEVLRVTVLYRQWGNNPDGTPRRQFQLYRAEIASVK